MSWIPFLSLHSLPGSSRPNLRPTSSTLKGIYLHVYSCPLGTKYIFSYLLIFFRVIVLLSFLDSVLHVSLPTSTDPFEWGEGCSDEYKLTVSHPETTSHGLSEENIIFHSVFFFFVFCTAIFIAKMVPAIFSHYHKNAQPLAMQSMRTYRNVWSLAALGDGLSTPHSLWIFSVNWGVTADFYFTGP